MKEERKGGRKMLGKILLIAAAAVLVFFLLGLIVVGKKYAWGPFSFLFSWEKEVAAIEEKYSTDSKGDIIFYGASNFALWEDMESDMEGYSVQNHAFGGSMDVDLYKYADRLLFPYKPSVVFIQTGSNDYVKLKGSDEEKVKKCMEYKREMFSYFHENLPDTTFVIMSGLLLPGRSEYVQMTEMINKELAAYAEETDYIVFVDSERMTYQDGQFAEDLFREDKIHLNHEGQLKWWREYIKPAIDSIVKA